MTQTKAKKIDLDLNEQSLTQKNSKNLYTSFDKLNGDHPLQKVIPDGHILYPAKKRHGGEVTYFNFHLAKEMGLIDKNHPHEITPALRKKILETFSIQIINEYDKINKTKIPSKDLLDRKYMATRYLQLQHPNKKGKTSGDGRSIWNGQIEHKGKKWDVSSCGTGATSLSPATHIYKKFFKTGDPSISYGCGLAEVDEGLGAAFFSEVLKRQGIETEKNLCIIEFKKNLAINIRASECLLRPSHFFLYLKQRRGSELKNLLDYYLSNQKDQFPNLKMYSQDSECYQYFLDVLANRFAQTSARFESEYIFCWMDWDGDNILMDGGIIDYGSIRQLGLFHHEYRYDDVERYSTTILEQKLKARGIVQGFIQSVDLILGKKVKSFAHYKKHPLLKKFDRYFLFYKRLFLLQKLGLEEHQAHYLIQKHLKLVIAFEKTYEYFERAKASHGMTEVADGITWDAIYCMRDLLRELPQLYLSGVTLVEADVFQDILRSHYAHEEDLVLTPYKRQQIKNFQLQYRELIFLATTKIKGKNHKNIWLKIAMKSSLINRYEKVTGDSITHIVDYVLKNKKQLSAEMIFELVDDFASLQNPWRSTGIYKKPSRLKQQLLGRMLTIVKDNREGL
jgi:uncharacterized protein YdiU (UPF0061 family)